MSIKNLIPRLNFSQSKEENGNDIKHKKKITLSIFGQDFKLFSFVFVKEKETDNTEPSQATHPAAQFDDVLLLPDNMGLAKKAIDIATSVNASIPQTEREIEMVLYELNKNHLIVKLVDEFSENSHPYELNLIAYFVERSIKL